MESISVEKAYSLPVPKTPRFDASKLTHTKSDRIRNTPGFSMVEFLQITYFARWTKFDQTKSDRILNTIGFNMAEFWFIKSCLPDRPNGLYFLSSYMIGTCQSLKSCFTNELLKNIAIPKYFQLNLRAGSYSGILTIICLISNLVV